MRGNAIKSTGKVENVHLEKPETRVLMHGGSVFSVHQGYSGIIPTRWSVWCGSAEACFSSAWWKLPKSFVVSRKSYTPTECMLLIPSRPRHAGLILPTRLWKYEYSGSFLWGSFLSCATHCWSLANTGSIRNILSFWCSKVPSENDITGIGVHVRKPIIFLSRLLSTIHKPRAQEIRFFIDLFEWISEWSHSSYCIRYATMIRVHEFSWKGLANFSWNVF